jgi:hypothetical protein
MPGMMDLIRKSAVSASVMQAAARGALMVPPGEMIEILVYIATHNKVFGAQARMTLAGWDQKAAIAAASNPSTSEDVLLYMTAADNLRPALLPALLENPSVSEANLVKLASTGSAEMVKVIAKSTRATNSPAIRDALKSNPNFVGTLEPPISSAIVEEQVVEEPSIPEEQGAVEAESETGTLDDENVDEGQTSSQIEQAAASESEIDEQVAAFMAQHAAEIAEEAGKPFQPLGGVEALESPVLVASQSENVTKKTSPGAAAAAAHPAKPYHPRMDEASKRDSTLQKIGKLDIKGRIQLAMKGSKEERSILIRDGTKIVALAVLDSPKITDGEVEGFASQKNVLEAVLRGIPMKRRFAKHYPIIRNLVFNPRTPLDLSLGLMKNMLVSDLRNLASNKEVSDTIRKLAMKMVKQKLDPTKRTD